MIILDLVAALRSDPHALAFLLRLLLLLSLDIVLRGCLSFLQRVFQIFGSLVGLSLVIDSHLCAAFVRRGDLLRHVGIRFVTQRTSSIRAELDVHEGVKALLVGHVFQPDVICKFSCAFF